MRSSKTLVAVAALALCASLVAAAPTHFKVGVTRSFEQLMMPGYVVFPGSDGVAYAFDPRGTPVHRWTSPDPDNPNLGYPEPIFDQPGHILTIITNPILEGCEVDCGKVVELDWDGNLVWEYEDTTRLIHHDIERLPNGNTLLMCSETITRPEISPLPIIDDCLIEVDGQGEIVWEWQTADHYDELDLSDEERQMIFDLGGDWSHGNAIDSIGADSPHADPRFREGNIIVSYRHTNLVLIVDRDTDEVVWQLPGVTIGQHHSHMIESGLQGAGNILIFDNGFGGMYPPIARLNSRVIEVDPLTSEIVDSYDATQTGIPPWAFFSAFVGSAQRLPNGNTLINEGMFGHAFEIDPQGRMVWEFVNPTSNEAFGFAANIVYRFTKVPVNWVGPLSLDLAWPTEPSMAPVYTPEMLGRR